MVLSVLVIGQLAGNPLVGAITARRPELRMPMVGGFLTVAIGTWAVLLGWPGGRVPPAMIVVAFALFSLGGPVSAIAFALARDYNPLHRVGTATGVVNVGGFVATTISALGIGVLLSLADTWAPAAAFRVALLTVAGVLLVGVSRVVLWWRRARAAVFQAEARGEAVPVQLRRRRWDAAVPSDHLHDAALRPAA
jgi:MFS family permease